MEKTAKIALSIVSLAALSFGIIKLFQLQNFAKLLSITPKLDGGLNNISIKNGNMSIPVAVDFANRTDQTMTIGVNSLSINLRGKEVANIRPNDKSVEIKANAISTLKGLRLDIPILSLISIVGTIVNTIITSGTSALGDLVSEMTLNITCTLNKSIVFSINNIKLGEKKDVNANNPKAVNGLGLVAASERNIKPLSHYEMYISPKTALKRRDLILIPDGEVDDTVYLMHDIAKKYAPDTQTLAKQLGKQNIPQTLQSIFDFVYNYIQYIPDNPLVEQVRRPLRTLWDRKGDCDCFSVLIGSILHNLKIPFKFRIAAYNGKEKYQHVYVIVPYNGKMLVCDPVVDNCFYEKPTSKQKDF